MITTGTHTRRRVTKKVFVDVSSVRRRGQPSATTQPQASTGTKKRKATFPLIRNQPVSAAIQASRRLPAATEAIATTNARNGRTRMYGIQSELNTAGFTAAKTSSAAQQAAAARADLVTP